MQRDGNLRHWPVNVPHPNSQVSMLRYLVAILECGDASPLFDPFWAVMGRRVPNGVETTDLLL